MRYFKGIDNLIATERSNKVAVCLGFQSSKIPGLIQGVFVDSVSDNINERIEHTIFHSEIVVDAEKIKREDKAYKKIPVITDFTDKNGNDCCNRMDNPFRI